MAGYTDSHCTESSIWVNQGTHCPWCIFLPHCSTLHYIQGCILNLHYSSQCCHNLHLACSLLLQNTFHYLSSKEPPLDFSFFFHCKRDMSLACCCYILHNYHCPIHPHLHNYSTWRKIAKTNSFLLRWHTSCSFLSCNSSRPDPGQACI